MTANSKEKTLRKDLIWTMIYCFILGLIPILFCFWVYWYWGDLQLKADDDFIPAFIYENNLAVIRILAFEVPSATGWDPGDVPFIPNFFLDARELIDIKIAALEAYSQELRPFPHARSIEAVRARASAWGSQIGMEAAEPFVLLREIVG